ncbi:uncharacterized protein [Venturia canescens]|uniref:uncharacterized protein isoform X2 n=1 Tax=Venturia canescens TaxID=32260 RepID=UPI001C9C3C06|nr:uncharacterized protein LOC122413880 isoform X2 [Venturia canescens]
MLSAFTRRFFHKGLGGAVRAYGQHKTPTSSQSSTNRPQQINPNVPGLSEKCVDVPNSPVGPGAAKNAEYKNPEYYCYHVNSFAEAEIEMAKFRLPAPSNKRKFVP